MERALHFKMVWSVCRSLLLLGVVCASLSPLSAKSEVFYSQEEALHLAFPDATAVQQKSVLLSAEQRVGIEARAKSALSGGIFTFYVGVTEAGPVGYAVIDTHSVRSMTETVLIVLSPEGQVRNTVVLAFFEPAEYLAPERWLASFVEKPLTDELWPGREVPRVAGSTLTTNAVTAAIRRAMAAHEVLIQGQAPLPVQ